MNCVDFEMSRLLSLSILLVLCCLSGFQPQLSSKRHFLTAPNHTHCLFPGPLSRLCVMGWEMGAQGERSRVLLSPPSLSLGESPPCPLAFSLRVRTQALPGWPSKPGTESLGSDGKMQGSWEICPPVFRVHGTLALNVPGGSASSSALEPLLLLPSFAGFLIIVQAPFFSHPVESACYLACFQQPWAHSELASMACSYLCARSVGRWSRTQVVANVCMRSAAGEWCWEVDMILRCLLFTRGCHSCSDNFGHLLWEHPHVLPCQRTWGPTVLRGELFQGSLPLSLCPASLLSTKSWLCWNISWVSVAIGINQTRLKPAFWYEQLGLDIWIQSTYPELSPSLLLWNISSWTLFFPSGIWSQLRNPECKTPVQILTRRSQFLSSQEALSSLCEAHTLTWTEVVVPLNI